MLNTDVITIDDSPPLLPPSQLTPVPDNEAKVITPPLTEEGIEDVISSFSRLYIHVHLPIKV